MAFVTIADSAAVEGQRLMLELVERNLRVQFVYTTLASFPSQAEAFHHSRLFSPHHTLDLVVACGALPPPPPPSARPPTTTPSTQPKPLSPSSQTPSLLTWLTATPPTATHPASSFPSPPPTSPLDRAITATIHSAHLALHHFRFAPAFDSAESDAAGADFADKHFLLLAPLASYAPPPPHVARDTSLAGIAAAAGVRALFGGVRDALGGRGAVADADVRARVNLVAVPDVLGGVASAEGGGGDGGGGISVSERDCAEVVLEVACAAEVTGTALAVTAEGVRDVSGA
ncbi:uncharacterized protein K452DRAFT_8945 [Aplosporella prunicola CBS 121167]|uniref:Uncharacterized protein n=1 Tax=Aplosporella prunicola CBS 121167 TaxID=1176127 RepID=A0A6A6BUQ9_9PEZI|nr:uncharacterized protein K452DRAFT_8945 [Aplosporella prunicola CBS 121167]KAF2147558.1 hypothetical protein K452DRAFT_8945 [Aplosporella prunicola CBS 121167]